MRVVPELVSISTSHAIRRLAVSGQRDEIPSIGSGLGASVVIAWTDNPTGPVTRALQQSGSVTGLVPSTATTRGRCPSPRMRALLPLANSGAATRCKPSTHVHGSQAGLVDRRQSDREVRQRAVHRAVVSRSWFPCRVEAACATQILAQTLSSCSVSNLQW